jgi:hypothetical protein
MASALSTGRASRRNGAFTANTCATVTGELGGVPRAILAGAERALYTMLQTPRPNSTDRSLLSRQISRSSVNDSIQGFSLEGPWSVFVFCNRLTGPLFLAIGVTGGVRLGGKVVLPSV